MTAAGLDRAFEAVLGVDPVEFALLQGPGGEVVSTAGTPPGWAPGGSPAPPRRNNGSVEEARPDAVLDIGGCHVLHLETSRDLEPQERDRILDLFSPAL